MMYRDITEVYLKKKGKTVSPSTALFVNREGDPLMNPSRSLSFQKFCEITGEIFWGAYHFRILMTNKIHETNNINLIEAQPFAQGHTTETARENYIMDGVRMAQSRLAHTAYREIIGMQETRVNDVQLGRSIAQQEEDARMRGGIMVKQREEMMKWKEVEGAGRLPTKDRTISDQQRVDLLDLLDECDSNHR